MPMRPCPQCGAFASISVAPVLAAKPPGTYAIAGVQPKIVAEQKYELTCPNCDLRVVGHLGNAEFDEVTRSFTGSHLVADELRRVSKAGYSHSVMMVMVRTAWKRTASLSYRVATPRWRLRRAMPFSTAWRSR